MWFLRIAEELLSNVVPAEDLRGAMRIAEELHVGSCESQSYVMWFTGAI